MKSSQSASPSFTIFTGSHYQFSLGQRPFGARLDRGLPIEVVTRTGGYPTSNPGADRFRKAGGRAARSSALSARPDFNIPPMCFSTRLIEPPTVELSIYADKVAQQLPVPPRPLEATTKFVPNPTGAFLPTGGEPPTPSIKDYLQAGAKHGAVTGRETGDVIGLLGGFCFSGLGAACMTAN